MDCMGSFHGKNKSHDVECAFIKISDFPKLFCSYIFAYTQMQNHHTFSSHIYSLIVDFPSH